jgi:F0F1-type ATP synthase alpha subunit
LAEGLPAIENGRSISFVTGSVTAEAAASTAGKLSIRLAT